MTWLLVALGFVALAALDVWTLRALLCLRWPSSWQVAALAFLIVGVVIGSYLGCFFRYRVAADLWCTGFPLPGVVFHLEDGRWVDYVGPVPVVVIFNMFSIASCGLLPVSAGLLIVRPHVGSSSKARTL